MATEFPCESMVSLNQRILDVQTRTESGTDPDSVRENHALAHLIQGGPPSSCFAPELVQTPLKET